MKSFILLLSAVTLVISGPVIQETPVFRSVIGKFVECQANSDLTLCIKENALKAAERLSSVPELNIIDGITILNESPRQSRSLEILSSDVEERRKQVGDRLWETTSYLIDNSAIEVTYGFDDEDESEEEEEESRDIGDVVEGRGKKKMKKKKKGMKKVLKKAKKKIKMLLPLALLFKAKLKLILAIALKFFAICLFKLAILAKVFLFMKIFGMMSSLLSKKGGGGGGLGDLLSKLKGGGESGGLGGLTGGLTGGLGGLGGGDSYASAAGSSGWDGDQSVGGGYDNAQGGPYARLGKDANDMAYSAQLH